MVSTCSNCLAQVRALQKKCRNCGFVIVIEPVDAAREKYLRTPSLGALLFTQGWALGARAYLWFLLSLTPVTGIAALIVLTLFGRRIAWKRGGWSGWEEFTRRMRLLDIVGVVWVVLLTAGYFLFRK